MRAALFGAHPYAAPAIGCPQERRKISREDVLRLHEGYYAPDNAVVVVAGDVTVDEVKQLAEATYGKVPARSIGPGRPARQQPSHAGPRSVVLKDKHARGQLFRRICATPSYATATAGEAEALELLAFILGGAKGSRLDRNLLQEAGPVSAAIAYYRTDAVDFGMLSLQVAASGADIDDIEERVEKVIDAVRQSGVTEAELERAKEGVLAVFAARSDIQEELASRYAWALVIGRTIAQVESWPDAIAKVTAEDVQKVVSKYLDRRLAVTGWLLPEADA